MRTVLILGATSAIAHATARRFARNGDRLFLVGRDADRLGARAEELRSAGASEVGHAAYDLCETDLHDEILDTVTRALGTPDVALIAHGSLPEQGRVERSFGEAELHLRTNFLSAASLATRLADRLEQARTGTLAVITSVAGDRGRRSNYVYGSAKAGLSVFLDGMRQRVAPAGVKVLIVKPGPVDTPMTAGMRRNPLWTTTERVSRAIHRAILRGRSGAIYVPWYWRPIMFVVRLLPL